MECGISFMWLLELWVWTCRSGRSTVTLSHIYILLGSSWRAHLFSPHQEKEAGVGGWGLERILGGEFEESLGPHSKSASHSCSWGLHCLLGSVSPSVEWDNDALPEGGVSRSGELRDGF